MAIEKKRMQQRYGTYDQFQADKENLLPNEFASVTSGDPNTSDGKGLYFGYGSGNVKRIAFSDEIDNGGGSGGGGTVSVQVASTTTGEPGTDAQVTNSGDSQNVKLNFVIPRGNPGAKGDTGDTPNLTIGTVQTLEPDQNATASITGTTENPLLNLGIPKGEKGDPGEGSEAEPYELPIMSDKRLGGGKAVTKTDEDVPVAVDPVTGQLFVPTYPQVSIEEGEEYKLIHDTGEIEEAVDNITIPLENPLEKVVIYWKIQGDEETATSQMFCLINGADKRFYVKQYSFQANTVSGGFAYLEENVNNMVFGYLSSSWNAGGYETEFQGQALWSFATTEGINNSLRFQGGRFGAGSRIIVYGVEKAV